MAQALTKGDRYLADFQTFEGSLKADEPFWVHQVRQQALARFSDLGFPTARRGNEKWKYTSVVPIANATFEYPFDLNSDEMKAADIGQFSPQANGWTTLVFVNGRYCETLSLLQAPTNDSLVTNLSDAFHSDRRVAEAHLARYATFEDDAFIALNTTFLKDGAFVHVPEDTSLQISSASGLRHHGHTTAHRLVPQDPGGGRTP